MSVLAAAVLSLPSAAAVYVGVAIGLSVIESKPSAQRVALVLAYAVAAVALPIANAARARRRGARVSRSIVSGLLALLVLHVLLLPLGVALLLM